MNHNINTIMTSARNTKPFKFKRLYNNFIKFVAAPAWYSAK
jgi:hypothetical protein